MDRIQIVQDVIARYENKEVEYGVRDCCQFAGAVYKEITGKDVMEHFDYSSEEEAYEIIEERGGWDAMLEDVLGEPIYQGFRNGDPVLVNIPTVGYALGVMFLDLPVILTEQRFIQAPKSMIVKGWKA